MLTDIKLRVKANPVLKRVALALTRIGNPVFGVFRLSALLRYAEFAADWVRFTRAGGRAPLLDFYPCLFDKSVVSGIDTHYFHQAVWAFRHIKERAVASHVDIASQVNFVGLLTCITHVTFVDIRPLELDIPNYTGLRGSIVELPFSDASIESLSCLHVIEHIGLGRYGDPIDPLGPQRAGREIVRVMRAGGFAYISTPIGRPRVQFNGQRVFAIQEVRDLFEGMTLVDFSMIDGRGVLHMSMDPAVADIDERGAGLDFGLGMFVFQKPGASSR